jgi:hypothetical protein
MAMKVFVFVLVAGCFIGQTPSEKHVAQQHDGVEIALGAITMVLGYSAAVLLDDRTAEDTPPASAFAGTAGFLAGGTLIVAGLAGLIVNAVTPAKPDE